MEKPEFYVSRSELPHSEHFTFDELVASETADRHGLKNEPPLAVMDNLQNLCYYLEVIRHRFGHPVKITSGYRCEELNRLVKGVPESKHIQGLAADITSPYLLELNSVVKSLKLPYSYINLDKHYIHFNI